MGFIIDSDDQDRCILTPTVQFTFAQPPGRPREKESCASQEEGKDRNKVTAMESRECDGILGATRRTLHQAEHVGNLGRMHRVNYGGTG